MTADLDDRLRTHYARRTADLPTQGPGLDASPVLTFTQPDSSRPSRLRMAIIGSAAAALIIGLVLVAGFRSTDDVPAASEPSAPPPLEPILTLPDRPDVSELVPATVLNPEPVDWYRLAPDLDVSWYQADSDSPSMLCWRTPVASECVEDLGLDTFPLVVPTAGTQILVITNDNTVSERLDLMLDDGTVLSAPIERDDQIAWGVSRFEIPAGRSVSDPAVIHGASTLGDATLTAAEPVEVTGATLPPSADLNESPITIAMGTQLSYWRWFPDLDISERQTATGDTEFCWRTPAGEGCIDDDFTSPKVGLVPTDGATIVLVRPALTPIVPAPDDPLEPTLEVGPSPTKVVATLSDGSTVTAEVNYGQSFGVGWARIATPDGITVTDARSE